MQRLYREERLSVRRRGGRKRAMGTRRPIEVPLAANQRWSRDFSHDQLTDGRRFRILAIVDDCTRECLALVADLRSRAGVSPASWIVWSAGVDSPARLSATTAPS